MLFPFSNFLVRRNEARKLSLTMAERTKRSGIRKCADEDHLPKFFCPAAQREDVVPAAPFAEGVQAVQSCDGVVGGSGPSRRAIAPAHPRKSLL
jgi:hypothetical protein